MDIDLKAQSRQATNDNKHVIEIDILSEKNHGKIKYFLYSYDFKYNCIF
jgi:hypothetical protein